MSIYPDLTPYYSDDSTDIRYRMNEYYRQGITLQQQFWNEADIDTRFRAGDQTLWAQVFGWLPLQNRRMFQFNRIRRIINLVTGYQRRNRKTSIIEPVENSDQETSDQLSSVLQWAMAHSCAYNVLSDSFDGACVTGLNMLNVWMDYRSDPINGEIRCDNISYNGVMVDPTFKKKDLSDANYVWRRKWMGKKQIESLLPERAEEIKAMPYTANRDDKFMFLPENFQFGLQRLLPYDEFWYLDYRDVKNIVDTDTGDIMEWTGDEESLKLFLHKFPQIQTVNGHKATYKLAICVGNRVMYDGPNPYGIDRLPFVPVLGYFEPDIPYFALKMQGIVRGLRDSQYIYNRKMVIMNDILESQINSGIKFKESALVDIEDAFLNGQGRRLALKDSSQMSDVEMIPPPDIAPGMMELSKMMGDEISQISGVNEELLGMADDDKSGILSMLRQGAGLTTLQVLFDQLDASQEMLGNVYIDLIQANFTTAKIQKILGKEPSEQFYSKNFQKYRCNVVEGSLTTSQKQMEFQQLIQLRELGLPIPNSVLINTAQLQNKKDLTDAMEQEAKQAEEQQKAEQQAAMEQQQVLTDSLHSKAESDRALAAERLAKIQLDQALNLERMSRSQEEREGATLNRIKAAKELEGINLDHLQKLLQVLKTIQETTMEPKINPQVNPQMQNQFISQ